MRNAYQGLPWITSRSGNMDRLCNACFLCSLRCADTHNLLLQYWCDKWKVDRAVVMSSWQPCLTFTSNSSSSCNWVNYDILYHSRCPFLYFSSRSWADSRESCVGVKHSLLLQRTDPPQWCHCRVKDTFNIPASDTHRHTCSQFFLLFNQ